MNRILRIKIFFCLGFLVILSMILVYPLLKVQANPKVAVKKVEYTSQNFRDPFQSPFDTGKMLQQKPQVKQDVSHLKVQGMVWISGNPQAIINDTVLRVGEVIEGAEVIDIRKEGVYVLYEGGQYIIRPTISNK